MARKGNQQRNSLDRNGSNAKFSIPKSVIETMPDKEKGVNANEGKVSERAECQNGKHQCRPNSPPGKKTKSKHSSNHKRNNSRPGDASGRYPSDVDKTPSSVPSIPMSSNSREALVNDMLSDDSKLKEEEISPACNHDSEHSESGVQGVAENSGSLCTLAYNSLRGTVIPVLRAANVWFERQKPFFANSAAFLSDAYGFIRIKMEHTYPIVWRWLVQSGKSNMNENGFDGHPRYEQPQASSSDFFAEPMQNSPTDDAFQSAYRRPADQSAGIPSTSGADAELSSEDEVIRLLNCNDHYSALGFSRYDNIDVSILKREYRKKAMLVHPDKNMGNEKAAEAFKKLQNGYEILLDSLKRKTYDDELRREDLLNYLRRFQTVSRKSERQGVFGSVFSHSEVEDEELHGDSRRIACKKCNDIHIWACTDRSKSRARWCQDCNDFHQAKDGDGWVEQSSQPFMFGFLQRVDPPCAYVCAESKIYKVTEWFICQGMRCPANTHKPSFHVNTSITSSKHSGSKGATGSGHKAPTTNLEESMTEEEFLEWLQNAVQSDVTRYKRPIKLSDRFGYEVWDTTFGN
ncbi:hypothetical protein QJS10_CPA16g01696 [Acorus calamus]|uniref:J domain-containing protein n=1 Tax=Acorus calamus TaxID=4465 RepID=A0AAV9D039_ACOCL|nr:hypothetical protein QJS10_CPA16g01696 [Acorus calamus]